MIKIGIKKLPGGKAGSYAFTIVYPMKYPSTIILAITKVIENSSI
jgi:hypothetical protein